MSEVSIFLPLSKEIVVVSFIVSVPSHDNPATMRGRSGIIVFSERCRLLFINQRAIELVGMLNTALPASTCTTALPPCLMDVTEEMRAKQAPVDAGRASGLDQIDRLVGAAPDLVRVQGISVTGSDRQGRRIVLILSRPEQDILSRSGTAGNTLPGIS